MMEDKLLLSISLMISALAILYLLFANLFRGTFITSDWIVVSVDLGAKVIIESFILFKRKTMEEFN